MVSHFDLANLRTELEQAKEQLSLPEVWQDLNKSKVLNQRVKSLENTIGEYETLDHRIEDTGVLVELGQEAGDESLTDEVLAELEECEKEVEKLRLRTLLKGKYDACNAIITIHPGAGGTEAQDWAEMLYRMYTRYCERSGFEVEVLDYQEGDEAGIKSVTFEANGDNAYGYLKAEKGVHRLVRISPFDANSRRQTSFAAVEVMPEIENDENIEIRPEDLKVDTYRSSGAGGQHVNKTESAVRITHIPTGIIVQCQNERSQIQNRERCMKMLVSKLIEKREREQMEQMQSIQGSLKKIEWGSQIRSYVFHPYNLVKDHRTGYETGNVTAVMDGDLDGFISDYLSKS